MQSLVEDHAHSSCLKNISRTVLKLNDIFAPDIFAPLFLWCYGF
jgi:hypothetical protein